MSEQGRWIRWLVLGEYQQLLKYGSFSACLKFKRIKYAYSKQICNWMLTEPINQSRSLRKSLIHFMETINDKWSTPNFLTSFSVSNKSASPSLSIVFFFYKLWQFLQIFISIFFFLTSFLFSRCTYIYHLFQPKRNHYYCVILRTALKIFYINNNLWKFYSS